MANRKIRAENYIQFLLGSPKSVSAVEVERVSMVEGASHDSITRFLERDEERSEDLWQEAKESIIGQNGVLVVDDSTLDKPYSREGIEAVCWHWSGKHHKVVKGINLVSLLWTDGDTHIPCDYEVYGKENKTKNELFQDMLRRAYHRGVKPSYILFDSWYGSAENLRIIGLDYGWKFLTRLKNNRKVKTDKSVIVKIRSDSCIS
jgi:putative transposase